MFYYRVQFFNVRSSLLRDQLIRCVSEVHGGVRGEEGSWLHNIMFGEAVIAKGKHAGQPQRKELRLTNPEIPLAVLPEKQTAGNRQIP